MKRVFDIFFAVFLLSALSPLLFLLILVALLKNGVPILHFSERVGRNNVLFRMPKLRTMKLGTPILATNLLDNPEEYLLPFGRLLRKYSLDELPQLWSILVGQMSFVGPRPALSTQHDLIKLRNICGVSVLRPGLTGLAQISGRDDLSLKRKVELDSEYLKKQSFLFDLMIILKTIKIVIFGIGVSY